MARVCVFCASSERIAQRYVDLAAEVGTVLARRGHTLVSGGGSVSCMGAVARAARAGGAHTVGVIPRVLVDLEVADHDADELLVTDGMRERKAVMEERSDGFLALPGGIGTLEELYEMWVARTLGLHDKPVVVLDPFDFYAPVRAQATLLRDEGFLRDTALDALAWTGSVEAAFTALEEGWVALGAERPAPTAEELLEAEP